MERKLEEIRSKLLEARDEWREIRTRRLNHKSLLLKKGLSKNEIRKDKIYKILKKQQSHYSKILKHIEKKLNKKLAKTK